MKKLCIWLCIISGLSPLSSSWAQEADGIAVDRLTVEPETEKRPITLRAGIDLYRPVRGQVDDAFAGFELVGDLSVTDNIYIAMEIGTEDRTIQSEQINFTAKGSYIKLGIDYNMFENWKGMDNLVYIGLRYARSAHELNVNDYLLFGTEHFFEDTLTTSGYSTGLRPDLNAQWMEFLAGIKVQLFNNLYMGFSLRLNVLANQNTPENFANLYIPGFNKVTDENRFGIGFNYTLSYALPFRFGKKTTKP